MKNIFLIRHSYAANGGMHQSDRERPLTEEGRRTACKMAINLQNGSHIPDHIISSPAQRAIETATIFARELNYPIENITANETIYERLGFNNFLLLLGELDGAHETLFVFGHNPTITQIAGVLSSEFQYLMPPCGIAGIKFDVNNWQNINKDGGKLLLFEKP